MILVIVVAVVLIHVALACLPIDTHVVVNVHVLLLREGLLLESRVRLLQRVLVLASLRLAA